MVSSISFSYLILIPQNEYMRNKLELVGLKLIAKYTQNTHNVSLKKTVIISRYVLLLKIKKEVYEDIGLVIKIHTLLSCYS